MQCLMPCLGKQKLCMANGGKKSSFMSQLNHIISMRQFDKPRLLDLFSRAEQMMMSKPDEVCQILKNKKLAVMFFQSSTRTRLSFETAMLNLGGSVLGFADAKTTRAGDYFEETVEDTVQVIGQMTDCIVMRHFDENSATKAAFVSPVPIINGGNGSNEHPTQALNDLWIMHRFLDGLSGRTIGLIGDPSTRVIRSMVLGLIKLKPKKIIFLPPPRIKISEEIEKLLISSEISFECYQDVRDILKEADALEILPIYLPDLKSADPNVSVKKIPTPDNYRITKQKVAGIGKNCLILHPGPRLDEISSDIDHLPQVLYFKQVKYANFLRMAILEELILYANNQHSL